jgi:hypothetical protein
MHAVKKVFAVTSHLIVALSFVSGFLVGAIFGETVINKFASPTFLTYFLAGG